MRIWQLAWLSAGLLLLVTACGRATPMPTETPTASISIVPPFETATPTAAVSATPPATAAAPTPTALADGLGVRLGTPDPNPRCPDHYPWFFDNPADECAGMVLNTWTVWQPFEHGVMIWTQEGGRTYVLLDDASPFKPYQIVSDSLGLPLPEPDPSIVPPEGFYVPERGFALFWRGLVPGHAWVRERLGWATAPVAAYSGFFQCRTDAGDAARCYLNGPRDEIIVLAPSVSWWTYVQTAVR